MNELQPKDQQALTTLLTQLDKSAKANKADKFSPTGHESFLEQPAVALHLIAVLLTSSGLLNEQQQEHRGMLLQYSLKMCLTNDELSAAAIAEFQQMIEQQLRQYLHTQLKPDFPVLRALINILFRAEILISDALLAQINQAEYPQPGDSAEFSEEVLHHLLADIAAECQDASLYELTDFLFEQFSQLPPEVAPMIAMMMLQATDEKLRSSATLFLLHPHPLFRKAMLDALPSLAQKKLLRSTDLQRLVWLRNWLQQDAHPTLDRCIKLLQRQQLPAAPVAEKVTITAVTATPMDNSGAMMLIVELKQDRHFLLFSFMLKQGDGIKDAFITPPLTRKNLNEMKSNIQGEMPVVAIDHEVMVALLEHFLLTSREQHRLPLALFLFRELTADVWGVPHAITEAQVRSALIGQKNRKNKLALIEFLAGWAKPSNQSKQDLATFINTQMEPMREVWRERFLVTALVFAKTANDMQQLFQAAMDIAVGLPLIGIDAIKEIAIHSLGQLHQADDLLQQLLAINGLDIDDLKQDMAAELDDLSDIFDLGLPELDPTKRIKRAVYQLKIQLKGSKPVISRTLQVMNTVSLESLHEILQIALGWEMEHSYEFKNAELSFVPPWFEFADGSFYSSYGQLRDLLKNQGDKMTYVYDFGDWWEHQITLEKVLPAGRSNTPTQLLKAKGECPPEDIGGIAFYNHIRAVLTDPTHQDHKKFCRKYKIKSGTWDADFVDIEEINQWLQSE
ncbi:plasmid pRiA4b ORF-3 family protein [Rheinheimera riviphila]|uniref:Plasmid pRiA4b ORF-3 family protein n=1 Tax=Rheinheimera riviphila TaxID=1834037 RepID=A0A437QIG3_9GAMM|nr:plasmid pRiA4b ORF-3 family protein [Rheinheimera riviphila]RVU34342.1 plasmid pRiA4b ORF-3 family protein [Rheinheimera riviphila]